MSKFSRGLVVLIGLCLLFSCRAFTLLASTSKRRVLPQLKASSQEDGNESEIPQLPAIGESSFGAKSSSGAAENQQQQQQEPLAAGEKKAVAFVSDKFELQYTCKICDTRNAHRVSRLAYRNGVVITVCKGCDSQHLIADNLGWTDYDGGFEGDTNTIEDYFVAKGQHDSVNRVSEDVFELEKLLDIPSGSIIDDDGNPALE